MRFKKTIFTLLAVLGVALTLMINDAIATDDCKEPTTVEILNGENGSVLSNMSFIANGELNTYLYSGLTVADVVRTERDMVKAEAAGFKSMRLFINSPGGSAFAGLALSDIILDARDRGWTVTAYANGIVASAAVPIFAVCSPRIATRGTIFMVHEAAIWKWPGKETASDIRSQQALMVTLQNQYLSYLVDHSLLTFDQWVEKESATTWFTVVKAMEWGLVDVIR